MQRKLSRSTAKPQLESLETRDLPSAAGMVLSLDLQAIQQGVQAMQTQANAASNDFSKLRTDLQNHPNQLTTAQVNDFTKLGGDLNSVGLLNEQLQAEIQAFSHGDQADQANALMSFFKPNGGLGGLWGSSFNADAPKGGQGNGGLLTPNGGDRFVPFKVTGGGSAPGGLPLVPGLSGPHYATGTATELGNYTGQGTFTLGSLQISQTGQVTGTFHGSFVFTAANGDQLAFDYGNGDTGTITGQLSADGSAVTNVTFDALFTPNAAESTGRFANVIGGGFTMIASAPSISLISTVPGYTAGFDYTWNGQGMLEFSK